MRSHTKLARTLLCMNRKIIFDFADVNSVFQSFLEKKIGMDLFIFNIKLNYARILIS